MERAVVVAAVRSERRQAVGVVPGSDQVVARRLARRIRAVRLVGVGFAKGRIVLGEAAVDLVGRDVQEAERLLLVRRQLRPVRARRFEQVERSLHIGADELGRTVDAAVDVALGREMDDGARPMGREKAVEQRPVADVAADEHMALVAVERRQVLGVAGVGEGVEVEHRLVADRQPIEDEVRADEAGAAGDEDHSRCSRGCIRPSPPADARVLESGGARGRRIDDCGQALVGNDDRDFHGKRQASERHCSKAERKSVFAVRSAVPEAPGYRTCPLGAPKRS